MATEKYCCENPDRGYQTQGMTSATLRYGCQSCQSWTKWYPPTRKQNQKAWDERRAVMLSDWEHNPTKEVL